MEPDHNPNIQVEITDASEFHCFKLVLNPKSAPVGELSACCGVPALSSPEGFICTGCIQTCVVIPAGQGRIEVMFHARSLVDLIHKCSLALCEWQQQSSAYLIERLQQQQVDDRRRP